MSTLNVQVSTGFTDHIMAFLEKRFLDILRSELHLTKFGMPKMLAQHQGKTVKWNRFNNIAASVEALTESVSPDGVNLSSAAVTATLAGYGQFVSIADYFQMSAINDTQLAAVDLLSYTAALSLDSLARNELDTNGTQNYADSANNDTKAKVEAGVDNIGSLELKQVLKNMRKNDVPAFEDGNYRGVIHPLMEFDLISESGASDFVLLASNTSNKISEKGEIGTAYGIKLVRSTNIRADETETNTYGNIFLGRNAYGTVDLQSAGLKIIRKPFGSAGTEDPLDQRATIGYKVYYAVKVLEAVRAQILWAYNAG